MDSQGRLVDLKIGYCTPVGLWDQTFEQKQENLQQLVEAGVDQIYMADHVSFRDGSGTDGFIEIAALSQLNPTLDVMISVYLLALRHPVPVARQLATINTIAPGRVTLGVGIGGEDRHEMEVCGVDPATRGRRTNECLEVISALMTGEPLDYSGEFFELEAARIKPAVQPAIPLIIGGRSNAALRRAATYGDGWIGTWCSPRRFTEAIELIDDYAQVAGRPNMTWTHGYQPWIGIADSKDSARELVAQAMEAFYKVPFEAFEKYTPYGTAEEVAEALLPYTEADCSMLNLKIVAESESASIDAAAEIARQLR